MSFNGIKGTDGQSYSGWASLAAGKTVKKEEEEKKAKVEQQFATTWGSASGVKNLTKDLATAGKKQRLPRRRIHVGTQAPRKDRWDRLVRKYLHGINHSEFEAFPYHNDSYRREGLRAEESKTIAQDRAFSRAPRKSTMSWGEFQEVGSSIERAGRRFVKKIDNKDFHHLPVKEIFENYDKTKLVKTMFGENYSFYIPCKVTKLSPGSRSESGVLEVTLDKDTGKPHHVFFKTIWQSASTEKFLKKRYGESNGATLSEMLNAIDDDKSEKFSMTNSKCRVHLLKV